MSQCSGRFIYRHQQSLLAIAVDPRTFSQECQPQLVMSNTRLPSGRMFGGPPPSYESLPTRGKHATRAANPKFLSLSSESRRIVCKKNFSNTGCYSRAAGPTKSSHQRFLGTNANQLASWSHSYSNSAVSFPNASPYKNQHTKPRPTSSENSRT